MKLANWLSPLFNATVLVALAYCVYAIQTQEAPETSTTTQERIEDYNLSTFSVVQYAPSGSTNFAITGSSLKHFSDNTAQLADISGTLYVNPNTVVDSWTIKADKGTINLDSEALHIYDNVQVQQISQHKAFSPVLLTTTELNIDKSEQIIETDAPITIEAVSGKLTGTGLFADLQKQQLRIKSKVKSHYEIP